MRAPKRPLTPRQRAREQALDDVATWEDPTAAPKPDDNKMFDT